MQESSTKPYLIRALHEWCTDNGYTPHIVVTVDTNTVVPLAHVHDGQITLNVGNLATNGLTLGNDYIEFQTRFSGVTEHIFVPVGAVSAIYARETGAGMGFDVAESQPYPGGEPAEHSSGSHKAVAHSDAQGGTRLMAVVDNKVADKPEDEVPALAKPEVLTSEPRSGIKKDPDAGKGTASAKPGVPKPASGLSSDNNDPKPPRLTIVK